ncbi:transposase [Methyloceanibacter methanicus]|uniref:transposase n=1 Tax=Methyloceanibacter methanicus TaxID=1774968 RepID=UPI000AF74AE9|nr:transposase [Methyloceanibacter methanicus]
MATETVIGGAAASLSLLDNLYTLVKNAKDKKGGEELSTAEIVKQLPAEAFSVAKQVSAQLIALEKKMKKAGVDLETPVGELESKYDWWKRKQYSPEFKAKVALEALKGEEAVSELASRFGIQSTMIHQWKRALLDGASGASERGGLLLTPPERA